MDYVLPVTLSYHLVREDIWEKFCARVNHSDDEELKRILLSWKNPSQVRPNYLMNKRNIFK